MLRRFSTVAFVPAVAARFAADAAPAKVEKRSKMQTLHKILTGEVQFKNKALLKECNVELMFGKGWKEEFSAYAGALPAAEKEVAQRQVARLALTRYTVRELGELCANGPSTLEEATQNANIAKGVAVLKGKGEAEFTRVAKEEAALANWSEADTTKFISAVLAAGKK